MPRDMEGTLPWQVMVVIHGLRNDPDSSQMLILDETLNKLSLWIHNCGILAGILYFLSHLCFSCPGYCNFTVGIVTITGVVQTFWCSVVFYVLLQNIEAQTLLLNFRCWLWILEREGASPGWNMLSGFLCPDTRTFTTADVTTAGPGL